MCPRIFSYFLIPAKAERSGRTEKIGAAKSIWGEIGAQNREIRYFLAILHDYVDKRVKRFILLLWQKYYIFSIQSIA